MNDTTTAPAGGVSLDATTVSEYDFILAIDASGSMGAQSKRYPGKTRWQEGQEFALGLARILDKYDADGIDVIAFGSSTQLFQGVTAAKVGEIFDTAQPYGGTPTDEVVRQVAAKQKSSGKNTVCIVLTDGEPSSQEATVAALIAAANGIDKDEALTFLFVQVGDDPGAKTFLEFLDDGLTAKGAKFDIVDTISGADAETIAPLDLINKAIND